MGGISVTSSINLQKRHPCLLSFIRRKVCLNFEVDHKYFFANDSLVIESLWIEQESHVKCNWLEKRAGEVSLRMLSS